MSRHLFGVVEAGVWRDEAPRVGGGARRNSEGGGQQLSPAQGNRQGLQAAWPKPACPLTFRWSRGGGSCSSGAQAVVPRPHRSFRPPGPSQLAPPAQAASQWRLQPGASALAALGRSLALQGPQLFRPRPVGTRPAARAGPGHLTNAFAAQERPCIAWWRDHPRPDSLGHRDGRASLILHAAQLATLRSRGLAAGPRMSVGTAVVVL
eukprot:5128697-Alexandrium_andersonii.AAC.1